MTRFGAISGLRARLLALLCHAAWVSADPTYESLAHKGETMMTTAEMATSAYDQIDQARTELDAVSTRNFTSPILLYNNEFPPGTPRYSAAAAGW